MMADDVNHVAVVAVVDGRPGRVIGLASAVLIADGSRELGLLVEDRHQAQGVGTMMLDALNDILGSNEPLCAYGLAENRWLLEKLARLGTLNIDCELGVCHVHVERSAAKPQGGAIRVEL